jgi:hypothetical protein
MMNVVLVMVIVVAMLSVLTTWRVPTYRCPQCEMPLPHRRRPRNLRQGLLGGWTCETCGAEVNRHGKQIPAKSQP